MSLKQTLKDAALRALAATERRSRVPLRDVRTFVMLEHAAALGTAIHTTPLIAALKWAVPDARIYVLASGFGREVFAGNPGVEAVVEMPNPVKDFSGSVNALRGFVKGLGGEAFATLTPLGNERTAVALATWRAGARDRVGFTLVPELYRAVLEFDWAKSQIANNLRIVEALGHGKSAHFEPQMFFGDEQVAYARGLLEGRDWGKPLAVFVTQTSVTQRKSWRPERFAAAGEFLVERYGAEIVFVGTETEREAIEGIRAGIRGRTWNVAGRTDLRQLAALLSLARVGLTLDTGTMHVGRAVGLPMCIVAPAWSPPMEWLPVGDERFVILKNLDMATAPEGYVIDEVSVEEVRGALAELMERGAARAGVQKAYPRG